MAGAKSNSRSKSRGKAKKTTKTADTVPSSEEEGVTVVDVPMMEDSLPQTPTRAKRIPKPTFKAAALAAAKVKEEPTTLTIGDLAEDITGLEMNTPKKARRSNDTQGNGTITTRGRFSPDWSIDLLSSPKKSRLQNIEGTITPPTPSPKKSYSKKRVTLELSDDEDTMATHSPSKKSRYRFTPPPLSTSDKNPFLDSEAEGDDVSEEHSELDEEDRPVDDKDVVDDDDQSDITSPPELSPQPEECELTNEETMMLLSNIICPTLEDTYKHLPPLKWVQAKATYKDSQVLSTTIPKTMEKLGYYKHGLSTKNRADMDRWENRIKQIVTSDKIAGHAVAARTNPTLFHASPDGKNNATVIKNTGSATREAFVTFGATASCNIFEATKVGRKSICVLPIGIEGLRLYGLIGGCLRTRDIMINTFSSGLSISTKTPSTATETVFTALPISRPKSPTKTKETINLQQFLLQAREDTALSNTELVPIIDVSDWVNGKYKDKRLDWVKILEKAPRMQKDVVVNSLVGVFHSIGTYNYNQGGPPTVSLNLYAVMVLLKPDVSL